jgi:hypothetical protein
VKLDCEGDGEGQTQGQSCLFARRFHALSVTCGAQVTHGFSRFFPLFCVSLSETLPPWERVGNGSWGRPPIPPREKNEGDEGNGPPASSPTSVGVRGPVRRPTATRASPHPVIHEGATATTAAVTRFP